MKLTLDDDVNNVLQDVDLRATWPDRRVCPHPVQLLLVSLCEVTVRQFPATTRSIYIVVSERASARMNYRLHLVHDDFECAPICPACMAEVPGRASRHQ